VRVRASAAQAQRLLAWATPWPAADLGGRGGWRLGHLLARQLAAAGEQVVDVPPKLAARVRLLASGDTSKNDPNDARSGAVAALRPAGCRPVRADDDAMVLKVRAKRHRDLGRARTQVVCRLHAVLCELVPGAISRRISAAHAARVLSQVTPSGAVARAGCELAGEFLQDLRRIDTQLQQVKKKLATAVRACGTTLTGIFGVGPVVAAVVIGEAGDPARFAGRDHFAACNGTAPVEVSSGNRKIYRLSRRGNRRLNHAVHMAAVTQISHRHSTGRACYDKKIAEGKTPEEPLRALKRQVSDAIFKHLTADAARAGAGSEQGPGGHLGNDPVASAADSHPERQLVGQATPGPVPTLRPRPRKKATSRTTRKTARTT
jgi:transposase